VRAPPWNACGALQLVSGVVILVLGATAWGGGGQGSGQAGYAGGAGRTLPDYRVGIFEDPTTDNYWAFLDTKLSIWNYYLLGDTKPSFFDVANPINPDIRAGGTVIPDLAEGTWVAPRPHGDVWVVEQPIRHGLRWSDGQPITARDFVFTATTVAELNLGGNWLSFYPKVDQHNPAAVGIVRVEAVDDYTARITFNHKPGLSLWPYNIGTSAPWMPEHFWADVVRTARGSPDPATALYAASGAGDPSGGSVVFSSREPGAFARMVANEHYHLARQTTTLYHSGAVGVTRPGAAEERFGGKPDSVVLQYPTGPFLKTQTLILYSSQEAAVLALRTGDVDVLLNPTGMHQGLRDEVARDPNLQAVVNPTNGFAYLDFNLRRAPMRHKAFRQALAVMIDRDFMANSVLQGAASPVYTMMPPGNLRWFDKAAAAEIRRRFGAGLDEAGRLAQAVRTLKQGGFSWAREPSYDAARHLVNPGSRLVGPDGREVRPLELLAPSPGDDPLLAAYAIAVERQAGALGIPLSTAPASRNAIRSRLFTAPGQEPQFDLVLSMWSNLGNAAFPPFYEIFWHSRKDPFASGGRNASGFTNAEFDRLADAYLATESQQEAFALVWQMERILADELPTVPLYDTPILEFYRRASVRYPFTRILGGLQDIMGVPWLVTAA
jgi:peptide/nickel transport system substrate-binding protein